MNCSHCSGTIGDVVQGYDVSGNHDAHALALTAAALEVNDHEVDCPLGVMVLDEASAAPGRAPLGALRRAAERLLRGEARVLGDRLLLNAALVCCVEWREGHACPLRDWLARQRLS